MSTTNAPTRQLGLAQLSLVRSSPPELIRLAADAGFDFIGARVRPVTATERPYDLSPGSPMLTETLALMRDTGVTVRDIEFLLLDGTDQRGAWLPMLEAGAALGAASLTVAASDTDTARLADTLAAITADGRDHGIAITLEPISYQAVNSLPGAGALARAAGCGIVVDTLHYRRFGATAAELSAVTDLVPMLQLCDGPAERPADLEALITESRSERGVPGEGGFRLAEIVSQLPAGLPISVEAPGDARVAAIGEAAYVALLKEGADAVLEAAAAMVPAR